MISLCVRPLGALALMLLLPWFSSTAYALTSDDFNSSSLDSGLWSVIDPVGDSSISVDGYTLQISVPAGTPHDVWLSGNMAPRVMQAVANTDFEVEAKFESPLSQQYQLQGILVEQDASNFLRFDFTNNGTDTRIFAAIFSNGSVSVEVNTVISVGSPMFLRVTRAGDQWTQWYSVDGVTWLQAVSFTHTLTVGTVGVFAGNAGGSAPQHIAVIDYFFNTASPISPEDANVPVDEIAPIVNNIQTSIQSGEVLVSWVTDELAIAQANYGEALSYELGSMSSGVSPRIQHEVLVTGLTPNTVYNFQISTEDANGNIGLSQNIVVQTSAIGSETFPLIDLWYGTTQEFGVIGSPQRWVNVLGNVSDPEGIASLSYSLNDGLSTALTIGTDDYRLASNGDFNVEIDRSILQVGVNTLVITAVDNLGYFTAETVTVNYDNGNVWPTPYLTDWASAENIQDVAQVVDGNWILTSTGVRTAEVGYDRLIAIGEVSWADYEIVVPFTVHSIDVPAGYDSPSNGPGVGLLMGWEGHNDINVVQTQPKIGWRPIGALGWYRWRNETTERLELLGSQGGILQTDNSQQLQFGLPYVMKMRVKANVSQGSTYNLKWWEAGQMEPAGWDLTGVGNLTTPQAGSLMLVAHHADVEFGDVSVTPVSTVGAVIGNIAEQTGTTDAIISWITDEPATAILRYGVDTAYGSTINDPAFNTSHSMTLTGLLPGQTVHYEISVEDTDGNITITGDRSFVTGTDDPPMQGSLSDYFDGTVLDLSQWTFVDPIGDSSVTVDSDQLALSVAGGVAHDVWTSGNNTARVTHVLPDEDFFAEVRFDSVPAQQYQIQGLLIEQDSNNFIRFDFYSDGSNLRVFATSFQNGNPTIRTNEVITSGVPLYMRVRRMGDQWTQQYSYDGSNWQTAASFSYALSVTSSSLFAGNSGSNAPAYTALVNYYWIDKNVPVDTTAPAISNVQVVVSANEAIITWDTDEAASSALAYGLTATYEAGSIDNAARVTAHSAILSGLTTGVLYHFQITVTDASDNASSQTGLTFTPIADSVPPVISDIQEQITTSGATISWTTDEPTTSSIAYGTDATYGSMVDSGSLNLTHGLLLTGFSPNQSVYYRITSVDASGNETVSADRTFITLLGDGPIPGTLSDEFTDTSLDLAQWAFVDPVGDSTVGVTGGQLALSVGGGLSHNVWTSGNNSARITHMAVNQDFFAEVKFDSMPTQRFQLQGLLVEQDANNFIRFDFYSDGSALKVFAATFQAGQPEVRVNATIATGGPLYLRIRREGDQWTQQYSYDGSNWQTAVTFAHTLTVASTSLFAGNAGSNAPAFTALVDYYWIDKDTLMDTTAPLISNVQVATSANEAVITWDTNEGASSSLAYGVTASYEIDSVDAATTVTAHSAILSGLTTGVLYHFQITVTDASNNSSSQTGLTFTPITDSVFPVISDIQEQITTSGATISWATDELATSSIEYGADITYGSAVSSGSLSSTHGLPLTGFLPGQTVYYRITSVDAAGNGAVSADRSFTTLLGDGPIPGVLSDEFNGGSLDLAQWTFIDPVGDSVVDVASGQLAISVGAGLSHDVWSSGNDSARVTHAVANQDFFAEVKFDSIPGQKYQLQGMLVEQDANNFIRFDFYHDGNALNVFAAVFQAGQPSIEVNTAIATGGSLYMRVKREGNQWTQQYSYDGSNWQTAITFAHTLTVASTSLFAGNAGSNAPAFTALVDYYWTDAQ